MTEKDLSNIYLWFDTEYTSLSLERARILQVALVITDADLNRIAPAEQDFNRTVRVEAGERLDPWVEENLAELVKRCRSDEAESIESIDSLLDAYMEDLLGPCPDSVSKRPLIAGNSVHADWALASKYLPSLIKRSHYRLLDVSGWKMVWKNDLGEFAFDKEKDDMIRAYFPGEFNSLTGAHDAHFDVLASIAELNFYRQHSEIHWPADA
jgi:oligoribonuclease